MSGRTAAWSTVRVTGGLGRASAGLPPQAEAGLTATAEAGAAVATQSTVALFSRRCTADSLFSGGLGCSSWAGPLGGRAAPAVLDTASVGHGFFGLVLLRRPP